MATVSGRLSATEVTAHLSGLRLTGVQASRLRAIVDLLADDGRFRLRDALVAGEFSDDDARAQDAFQDLRRRVNAAAERAGVPLALELDAQKTTPDTRYGWFTGGDLVDAGLVAFTGSAADRTGVPHPVEQAVAEVGASRRTRVYVSHVAADVGLKVGLLLDRLRTDLALDRTRTWEVDDTASPRLGEFENAARDRLAARADVRVALLSPAYLLDRAERDRVLGVPGPTVAFALGGLPDIEVDLTPLHRWEIGERDRPWDVLTRPDQRQRYARHLVDEICKALDSSAVRPLDCPPDEVIARHTAAVAERRRGNESAEVVPGEVGQTTLSASLLDRSASTAPPLPAVDRLVEWALDARADAPRLCALLGDVGMGKTTTAKLFARRLLDLRAGDPRVPLPILFDLRDVRTTDLADKLSTDHVLTSMFEHNRAADAVVELTAAAVRRRIAQGGAVVIFDGLDEVLVHLEPADQRLFTAQLFRAVEERSGSRMLLTCRTQYFRTLRDEAGYFVGHDREGLRGENYLALVMLPFRPEQVRAYLAANLGWDDARVGEFLDTIAAVHDLTDLARRPVTLKMIADQVRVIEGAKLRGEQVRAVDLYGEFVDRWLDRDAGKHSLRPEHKRLLMEHAAASLWRDGRASWGPDDLDDWLLEVLDARPDLKRRYRAWQPDLWTADFRTATFLSREGDTFSFAHRSLFEYFLARYLVRSLTEADDTVATAWTLPVPSPEALDFLGQSLAALPDARQTLKALLVIGRRYIPQASELALAYALRAQRGGYPHQSLAGVVLSGAQLREWRFGVDADVAGGRHARSDAPWLSMAGADLSGADLRDAVFDRVDLTGADLSGADLTTAELHRCRLTAVRPDRARATGTILRASTITGVDLGAADAYRAQALLCDPPPAPRPGWLFAPDPAPGRPPAGPDRLRVLTGRFGPVRSAEWSPDGSRIAFSDDGGARIWDAATGELVRELLGHQGAVVSVGWSPDGSRIVGGGGGGGGGGVRVWDAVTGELVRELPGPAGWVQSVGWSPDGSRIVAGGTDGVVLWDAMSGELVRELPGPAGWVQSVGWSPDGSRIVSGGDDGAVVLWDAVTGRRVRELAGRGGFVRSVGWSPDGSRIVSAGGDGVVRLWDAVTGQRVRELAGPARRVRSVGWSPDEAWIVAGGDDGAVRVWDAVTGKLVRAMAGHVGEVRSVGWSPDGSWIVTGGADGAVRVWDAATGAPIVASVGLPGGETAVFDADATLTAASPGAWRWLGWPAVEDGRMSRLPAETHGPLPPLRTAGTSTG